MGQRGAEGSLIRLENCSVVGVAGHVRGGRPVEAAIELGTHVRMMQMVKSSCSQRREDLAGRRVIWIAGVRREVGGLVFAVLFAGHVGQRPYSRLADRVGVRVACRRLIGVGRRPGRVWRAKMVEG